MYLAKEPCISAQKIIQTTPLACVIPYARGNETYLNTHRAPHFCKRHRSGIETYFAKEPYISEKEPYNSAQKSTQTTPLACVIPYAGVKGPTRITKELCISAKDQIL